MVDSEPSLHLMEDSLESLELSENVGCLPYKKLVERQELLGKE